MGTDRQTDGQTDRRTDAGDDNNPAMLKLSWKFGESKINPFWVIVLTSSSGTNYVPNKHEDIDRYVSFTIPSVIMPC